MKQLKKWFLNLSIQRKYLYCTLGITLVVLLAASFFQFMSASEIVTEQTVKQSAGVINELSVNLDHYFDMVENSFEYIANNSIVQEELESDEPYKSDGSELYSYYSRAGQIRRLLLQGYTSIYGANHLLSNDRGINEESSEISCAMAENANGRCVYYNAADENLIYMAKQIKDVLTLYGGLIILKVIMETKYQNLINYIQEQISDGQLGPGEKVPSENQLSEQFHISRQTVRKAIGTLEEDGLVQRIRGSGTYVSFDRQKNLEQRNSIAVVTTYVDSYIFPRILQGMQNTLFESGFSVQIYFTNNTLDREKSILKDLLKRDDVAGVIVEGTKSGLPNPNLDLYRHLMARKIPLLFFNTYYPELEAPHVSLNDAEAAYKAVRYLIDKGHQKIGAILKLDDGQGRQRYLGYLKAMEEAGLTVTDSRMVWIDTDESKQLGYCRDRILNRVEECTALLAYNDQIAFQLIRMLTERNIRVPEDVSVISIDDSDLARHSEVPITSLPHPKENLGKKAAETLLQMIAGRKKDLTYEFDTRVVERESVAECTENGNKK